MPKFLNKIPSLLLASGLILSLNTPVFAASGPTGLNGIRTEPGPGVGQVTLSWYRYYPSVDNFRISYGTSSGKYVYGTTDIGNNVVEIIGGLVPGRKYYFFLQPISQGQPLVPVSPEVSEVAASSPQIIVESAGPFGKRALTAISGPSKGQVKLTWNSILAATTDFSIAYGTKPGVYTFGATNILNGGATKNNSYSFTVNDLNPGQRYYFAIIPVQNGQALYSSGEVSQVAHR